MCARQLHLIGVAPATGRTAASDKSNNRMRRRLPLLILARATALDTTDGNYGVNMVNQVETPSRDVVRLTEGGPPRAF